MRGQSTGRLCGSAVTAALAALLGLAACTSSPWSDSEPAPDRAAASAPGLDRTAASAPGLDRAVASAPGLDGTAASTSQPDQTPGEYDHLAGAWSSTVYGASHVEVSIPDGRALRLRVRCTGTGELRITMSGDGHKITEVWGCASWWSLSAAWYAPYSNQDHGPFAIAVDRPGTITAWDIEAYDLAQTAQDIRNASPRPSTS